MGDAIILQKNFNVSVPAVSAGVVAAPVVVGAPVAGSGGTTSGSASTHTLNPTPTPTPTSNPGTGSNGAVEQNKLAIDGATGDGRHSKRGGEKRHGKGRGGEGGRGGAWLT